MIRREAFTFGFRMPKMGADSKAVMDSFPTHYFDQGPPYTPLYQNP